MAVGVVSIPAGLIASGFAQIIEKRVDGRRVSVQRGNAGDDWYEFVSASRVTRAAWLSLCGSALLPFSHMSCHIYVDLY